MTTIADDSTLTRRNAVMRQRLRQAGLAIKTTAEADVKVFRARYAFEGNVAGYLRAVALTRCARGPVPVGES